MLFFLPLQPGPLGEFKGRLRTNLTFFLKLPLPCFVHGVHSVFVKRSLVRLFLMRNPRTKWTTESQEMFSGFFHLVRTEPFSPGDPIHPPLMCWSSQAL